MRAPTPAEVSEAAARHLVPYGRTVPALAGLTMEQLCEATRATGFAPESMRAEPGPEYFVAALHTYLLSGIPVVLALKPLLRQGEGHAVTAVGFQMGTKASRLLQMSVPVRSAFIQKLYVHDDRLGPYARAHILMMPKTGKNKAML